MSCDGESRLSGGDLYQLTKRNGCIDAVLQNELELAMRNGLKLNDAIYIEDRRSMNADESPGIETVFHEH
jgi:hypothetical protein